MEFKLIKLTEGYIIVSDENKKENDYVYHPGVSKKYTAVDITKKGNDRYTERNHIAQGIYKHIPTTNDWYLKERKIIASTFIPELPNIDFNNLEEEFGIVDVEKLAKEANGYLPYARDTKGVAFNEGFIEGFNKCLELNKDKLLTLDDISNFRKILEDGVFSNMSCSSAIVEFDKFIKSLQKTERDIKIETEEKEISHIDDYNNLHEFVNIPKITNNTIKIISTF